jgi:hypothetical protein
VSTPMTCTKQSSRQSTDIIDKIIAPVNTAYLEACIYESLSFLQAEFFPAAGCERIERLRGYVGRAETAHAHKVGIFFLLLNIDRTLKQKLMDADRNHAKLVRFFSDLRTELVTGFFCSAQPVLGFVQQCTEVYLIA